MHAAPSSSLPSSACAAPSTTSSTALPPMACAGGRRRGAAGGRGRVDGMCQNKHQAAWHALAAAAATLHASCRRVCAHLREAAALPAVV